MQAKIETDIAPDVVFVGAGPVGLFTAINAKLLNPKQEILMLERNETYSRKHILIINKDSYKGAHPDPEFQGILKTLHGPVPTETIESKLREFAVKLGITIKTEKVTDAIQLAETYPTAHTIVGADGAKSLVRQQIFDDKKVVDENLQYIVEVKYLSNTPTKAIDGVPLIEGLSRIPHFVYEHVGKHKNGKTPVSLFFFVDKKTYEQVYQKGTQAYQKNKKVNLTDITGESKEMTELANSIHPWLAYRKYYHKDTIMDDSVTIAGVALNNYKSEQCVINKEINKKKVRYALVGDAKLGIPFFRALNAGIIGGIKAAQLISCEEEYNSYTNQQYDIDMSKLAAKEIANAHKKNITVNIGSIGAFLLRFASVKLSGDVMPEEAKEAMKNARLTPYPFHVRHRFALTFVATVILLTGILIATGGLASIPIVGGYLAAHLAPVAANFVCCLFSALATTVLASVYKAVTSLISYSRTQWLMRQNKTKEQIQNEQEVETRFKAALLDNSPNSDLKQDNLIIIRSLGDYGNTSNTTASSKPWEHYRHPASLYNDADGIPQPLLPFLLSLDDAEKENLYQI